MHWLRSSLVSLLLVAPLPSLGQERPSVEGIEGRFVLTGIGTFDPVYLDLQHIKNDIHGAELQVLKAQDMVFSAMEAPKNMSLSEATHRFRSQPPPGMNLVLEGGQLQITVADDAAEAVRISAQQITEAIATLEGAKTSLAEIPARLGAVHTELCGLSDEVGLAGRAAGLNTRERLQLVRTVEANRHAATLLPIRATEGVKQANLMLHHIKSLAD